MDFKEFFKSKTVIVAGSIVLALIIILLVFQLGVFVGEKKARFSYQWGENYYKNFAGPRGGFIDDFRGSNTMAPHGVFGEIIKNENPFLFVKGADNAEKIVVIGNDTVINRFRDKVSASSLKSGEKISVLGVPDEKGGIAAKLIRVLLPDFSATSIPEFTTPRH